MYEYRATITRVIDADTVYAQLDLGIDVRINLTLRLYGINAPENSTDAGKLATATLRDWIEGMTLTVRTIKDRREKYGRYLANLYFDDDDTSINQRLIEAGLAVEYLP